LGRSTSTTPLILCEQEAGQAGAAAAAALQRPAATTGRPVGDKAQQRFETGLIAVDLELGDQAAVAVQDRGGVAVAVGCRPR
jgi:hypothetical protein